jgi:hypothetical protein
LRKTRYRVTVAGHRDGARRVAAGEADIDFVAVVETAGTENVAAPVFLPTELTNTLSTV